MCGRKQTVWLILLCCCGCVASPTVLMWMDCCLTGSTQEISVCLSLPGGTLLH